ncbi:chymotrypsin inhibitor-like [Microplitis mediator]|uniref:chymotrypsin inhibitor-like n=1 Tax=Microplitis mediator TaxID=375433 RepID=UPI0025533D9A|nr:chymotrypsin inhibitor-like [Microplitis mediator]
MSRNIFMLIIVILAVGINLVYSDDDCGPHAKWNDCGSPCTSTCDHKYPAGGNCMAVCEPGCYCEKGYIKETDGSCVKECKPRK